MELGVLECYTSGDILIKKMSDTVTDRQCRVSERERGEGVRQMH